MCVEPLIASLVAHLVTRRREAAILVAALFAAAFALIGRYFGFSTSRSPAWLDALAAAFMALPVAFVIGLVLDLARRLSIEDTMPIRGRCKQCGYDLTANVSGACPECGKRFCLRCGNDQLGFFTICPGCGNEKLAPVKDKNGDAPYR